MIVPTMTSQELANEIIKDYDNVVVKAAHILKKTHKMAMKSRNKHYQQMFEYKSPMKNDWLIFVNHHIKDPVFVPVVHYINKHGINGILVGQKVLQDQYGQTKIQNDLSHYTSHFLDRYNERFLQNNDISKLDVLKHFIIQNPMVQTKNKPDDKEYENGIFGRFNQGVGMGYKEELLRNTFFHFKTFLSTDMLFESQDDFLQITSNQYKAFWDEVYGYRNVDVLSDGKE